MRLSPLTQRITGSGASAWDLHSKASRQKAEGKDVIVMSVGDPDFATAPEISNAAKAALSSGDTHYTEIVGRKELRQIIAQQFHEQSGQYTTSENVIVLAGAQNALFSASLCIATGGDEVIALEPMYITYEASICVTGAKLVRVAQPAESGFRPDIDAIKAAITPRTRAIFLTTPNNPTGVVLSRDELASIAEIAIENDLWVVSDEVYGSLIFEGEHFSIAALPGMADRTVTIGSLSKSHAMTGWRVGWAIGPEGIIRSMEKVALCMLYGLPGFSQEAAKIALTDFAHEPQRMREIYQVRRDRALSVLASIPELLVRSSQAGMFLLVDVTRTGLSSKAFANKLYERTGVCVLDAEPFGSCTKGHIRLSFTLGEKEIEDGCHRICNFVHDLRPGKGRAEIQFAV